MDKIWRGVREITHGVEALGDDEVAEVEGNGFDFDEDFGGREFRGVVRLGVVLELEFVEAGEVGDDPFLSGDRCHCCCVFGGSGFSWVI